MTSAIKIIQKDHINLTKVLRALEKAVGLTDNNLNAIPDFALVDQIIYYIRVFADQFHHPKEDGFLFKALRNVDDETTAVIEELEKQHEQGRQITEDLASTARFVEESYPEGMETLHQAVQVYVDFQRAHIGLEESKLLPVARQHLGDEDWRGINRAFGANSDPLFGENLETGFQALFEKITR